MSQGNMFGVWRKGKCLGFEDGKMFGVWRRGKYIYFKTSPETRKC